MESDHGRYECVASNSKGVAYSFAAMLYVKGRLLKTCIGHFCFHINHIHLALKIAVQRVEVTG